MDVPADLIHSIEAFHAHQAASSAAMPPRMWRTDGHDPGVEWTMETLTDRGRCPICGGDIKPRELAIVKLTYMNTPYNDMLVVQYHEACVRGL